MGIAPVYEPGLNELVKAARARLTITQDAETAVRVSDVTFIVVATPTDGNGRFSTRCVLEAAEPIGRAIAVKTEPHLVVLTSTVMPGTTEHELKPLLEEWSGKRCGRDFGLCYNPEFVALGSAIHDLLNPDFVLIGESDPVSGERLAALYRRVCENGPVIARMGFVNAELTKLAVNTFVTTKITFANMLARMCERLPGADADLVTAALGLDSRIGCKYLKGAIGYGGPCFPRDNVALATLGRALGTPAPLAEATDRFNREQVRWLAELVKQRVPHGGRVAILGLSYKPNSDVVEESQGWLLAQSLLRDRVAVTAFDPAAIENARKLLVGDAEPGSPIATVPIAFASSITECIADSDVVVVTTPWDAFRQLTMADFARNGSPRVLIDCWRLFRGVAPGPGVDYVPVGVGGL